MNRSRFIFFLVVLGVVFGIARWNSRHMTQTGATPSGSQPPAVRSGSLMPSTHRSPAPASTPSPALAQAGNAGDLTKAAERIMPAVIALSIFDASGKLLHEGTGFFVSADGDVVTSRSLVEGGTNAVAKTADGNIYNVSGILAEKTSADLAVLKAQVKEKVPFVTLNKAAPLVTGDRLAAINSPLHPRVERVLEMAVAGRQSDTHSEWLELAAPVPGKSLGSPVLNAKGEVLGFVALQRGDGPAVNVVRLASAVDSALAHLDRRAKPTWAAMSEAGPAPPAAGPPPAPKAPPPARMRLTYNPAPRYPTAARHSFFPVRGSGRYRIYFKSDGTARDVKTLQSTRSQNLDTAAVDALRKWKATPGQEWSVDVPITFQP